MSKPSSQSRNLAVYHMLKTLGASKVSIETILLAYVGARRYAQHLQKAIRSVTGRLRGYQCLEDRLQGLLIHRHVISIPNRVSYADLADIPSLVEQFNYTFVMLSIDNEPHSLQVARAKALEDASKVVCRLLYEFTAMEEFSPSSKSVLTREEWAGFNQLNFAYKSRDCTKYADVSAQHKYLLSNAAAAIYAFLYCSNAPCSKRIYSVVSNLMGSTSGMQMYVADQFKKESWLCDLSRNFTLIEKLSSTPAPAKKVEDKRATENKEVEVSPFLNIQLNLYVHPDPDNTYTMVSVDVPGIQKGSEVEHALRTSAKPLMAKLETTARDLVAKHPRIVDLLKKEQNVEVAKDLQSLVDKELPSRQKLSSKTVAYLKALLDSQGS
jgi:hypothetical protein